jgi:hypothetical protein
MTTSIRDALRGGKLDPIAWSRSIFDQLDTLTRVELPERPAFFERADATSENQRRLRTVLRAYGLMRDAQQADYVRSFDEFLRDEWKIFLVPTDAMDIEQLVIKTTKPRRYL